MITFGQVIPRIFHQIWVGPAPFPPEFEAFQESWRSRHPEWELRFWTDENLPGDLRHREIYDSHRSPAERSDILRLELLWRHGGVYLDADFECRRPLDELLGGVDFFTALLKPGGRVNNAIIGSIAQHPILERALAELRVQERGTSFDKTASGPLFFDTLLKDFPGVTIFQADWFYPTTPEQRQTAYAVHHSARSWKDAAGWRQTALRAEERLERERNAHAKTSRAMAKLQDEMTALRAVIDEAGPAAPPPEGVLKRKARATRRGRRLRRRARDQPGAGASPAPPAAPRGSEGGLRILFFLRGIQYGRMFENFLREALDRGHSIHIALALEKRGWSGSTELFDSLRERYAGFSWETLPPRDAPWDVAAVAIRHGVDYLRYLEPEYAAAEPLRERARQRAPILLRGLLRFPFRGVSGRRVIGDLMRAVETSIPVPKSLLELIRAREPDVVLASPLIGLGSIETDHLRAARACGRPTVLLVASWDNLSNKGILHDVPVLTVVWNQTQVAEAVRLHNVPPERVVAVGAHSFDHWFSWTPSTSREEFAAAVGLDPGRPLILYLGSSSFIAGDETVFVRQWLSRLRAHPRLREVSVILRPHPYNADCWSEFPDDPGRTVIWPRGGAVPDDHAKRSEYFDTLAHSSAVVGVNTSGLIEASILRRPVLTLVGDHFKTQTGTIHFSYIAHDGNGHGFVTVGHDWDEHLDQVADAIDSPGEYQPRFDSFLSEFIRPAGLDVAAAPRAVDAVEAAASAPVEVSRGRLLTPFLVGMTPAIRMLLPLFDMRTWRGARKSRRKLFKRLRRRRARVSRDLRRRAKRFRSNIRARRVRPAFNALLALGRSRPRAGAIDGDGAGHPVAGTRPALSQAKPPKPPKAGEAERHPRPAQRKLRQAEPETPVSASDDELSELDFGPGGPTGPDLVRIAQQTLEYEAAIERKRQRAKERAAKGSKEPKGAKPAGAAKAAKPPKAEKADKAGKAAGEAKAAKPAKGTKGKAKRRPLKKRARRLVGRTRKQVRRRAKLAKRSAWTVYNMRNRRTYASGIFQVPSRDEIPALLNARDLGGKGAEIGVKRGGFSELLLRNWDCELLISIDPWLSVEWDEYVDRSNVTQSEFEENFMFTKSRLAAFGPRSEIWRLMSVEAAERVADGSLDFVYIDARHDYESVLEDLHAWYSKLKPGAIFAGHDYVNGQFAQGDFGVKSAVDEFFGELGIPVHGTCGPSPVEMFPTWIVEIPTDGRELGSKVAEAAAHDELKGRFGA